MSVVILLNYLVIYDHRNKFYLNSILRMDTNHNTQSLRLSRIIRGKKKTKIKNRTQLSNKRTTRLLRSEIVFPILSSICNNLLRVRERLRHTLFLHAPLCPSDQFRTL